MTYQLRNVILAAALALVAQVAQATLILDYSILDQVQTVGPTDVVTFHGRLTNDLLSDENAIASSIKAAGYTFGNTFPAYQQSFGPNGNFFAQFGPMNIAPGASFDFVAFRLTPNPGPVPVGDYVSGQLSLHYANAAGEQFVDTVDNITVHVGLTPEPATLALLGLGLAGLGFARRKQ